LWAGTNACGAAGRGERRTHDCRDRRCFQRGDHRDHYYQHVYIGALRLLEADFLLTHFQDPLSASGVSRGWQDNARLSTGIVFRFGGNPPPPSAPLGASCSANPEMAYASWGDWIAVRADASNPANYLLNYS
jgi:hypothetical protein